MNPTVSMVIPTWNGSGRIHIPLEGLARQVSAAFEVIVVDNASSDGVAGAAEAHRAWAELTRRGVRCSTVFEARPGATYARIRGVLQATGDLVCFLDDDNAPEPGYIEAGLAAMADPRVGVLVSRIYPIYERQPPRSVLKREHLLAVNCRLGGASIEWGPDAGFAPTVTAGMWVRRQAFLATIPWQNPEKLLADRKGESLACGGDIEIGYLIGRGGYKRLYVPGLRLMHHIPSGRLECAYFCRLIQGIVRSEITLSRRYLSRSSGRAAATGRLILALLASPWLLTRTDGRREALFVLASRWAQLQGPYRMRAEAEPN